MIATMQVKEASMAEAAKYGYMNATDCADYLVGKGLPFRECHEIIGRLVLHCIEKGCAIEDLSIDELKGFSDRFEEDIYDKISVEACINAKVSEGGTSFARVAEQLEKTK